MKLNHLILVICTGILVGFSACKKDPFTEADAIAAQKELITMKYGYELQLKNIEAAIQKAHDDAQITMKNLEIKGASDLSKQEAAQEIAFLLAKLEKEKQWTLWFQKFEDSVKAAHKAAKDAAEIAAVWSGLSTTYNVALRILDNSKAISGATIKVLNFDGVTFYTATSDANGYIYIKNQKFLSGAPLSIVVPNSTKAVYPIYYGTPSNTLNAAQKDLTISSYDPSALNSISGTIYASLNLTDNNRSDAAGAGLLVTATKYIESATNVATGLKDSITLSFVTSTLSSGAYSLSVPASKGPLDVYTLTIPKSLTGYQRAYTLVGSNPYQALPTRSDSVLVKLQPSGDTITNTTWNDKTFFASYFLTLPDSDADGGYSATLTDPKGILTYLLNEIDLGGANTPDGYSAPDSSLPDGQWIINPDGFLLNNGHLKDSITTDDNIMYELPVTVTLDSSRYDYFIAKPVGDPGDQDSAVSRTGVRYQYLLDQLNEVPAATLLAAYGTNTAGVWTPTIDTDEEFANDTLSVSLVDLTGRFLDEEPEFLAVVDAETEEDGLGRVTEIILLEDGNHGMFNITAVLDGYGAALDSNWFTNWAGNSLGQTRTSLIANGNQTTNDYTRINYSVSGNATSVNWNYGKLFTDTYFNATGVVNKTANKYGQQTISGSASSYISED